MNNINYHKELVFPKNSTTKDLHFLHSFILKIREVEYSIKISFSEKNATNMVV